MKNRVTEILKTEYPVIQGGMAWVAEHNLAAAVSNAGGLGIIGAASAPAEIVREEIRKCKELTDKPFGVNIMLLNPNADDVAKIVVEEGVQVVTTGAGNPGKYMELWKSHGMTVIPVCASVLLAQRMVRIGADAIIAEGTESGGHVGEMTTMALVPQMADSVSVPVIAAGGIADGRQLAAAYALGACGAQIGTVLLTSEECPIHDNYKQALLDSGDNSTVVTGRSVNAPVRILKNRMARTYLRRERAGATQEELEQYTLGSLRKAVFEGNTKEGSLMAGQVCGQLKEIQPLEKIFARITEEADEVLAQMC